MKTPLLLFLRPVGHSMRLVVIAGLAAALSAAAAGSVPAARSAPAGHGAQLAVYYLFHGKFTLEYEVDWMTKAGSEQNECSTWRVDRGSSKVVVRDAPWVQKTKRGKLRRTDGVPGSIRIPGASPAKGVKAMWADGSAVGRVSATMDRTWIQQGGAIWNEGCGGPRPEFRPSPSDCGTRASKSRRATFLPQTRRQFDTLQDVTGSEGNRATLSFSMNAPAPYKRCTTHGAAPDLPANFGFWVGKLDVRALARLDDPGETTQVHHESSGDCSYETSPDSQCTFRLELTLDLTRWRPGRPFP